MRFGLELRADPERAQKPRRYLRHLFGLINVKTLSFVAQNNLLRSSSPGALCAFLCNSGSSKFVTIRTIREASGYSLQSVNTIPAPEFDLVEFDVNENRVWGLWCNSQGEYNISSYLLLANSESNWISAALETLPERKMEPETDPRQANCSYIFYPGRFQRDVIDRALVVSPKARFIQIN